MMLGTSPPSSSDDQQVVSTDVSRLNDWGWDMTGWLNTVALLLFILSTGRSIEITGPMTVPVPQTP